MQFSCRYCVQNIKKRFTAVILQCNCSITAVQLQYIAVILQSLLPKYHNRLQLLQFQNGNLFFVRGWLIILLFFPIFRCISLLVRQKVHQPASLLGLGVNSWGFDINKGVFIDTWNWLVVCLILPSCLKRIKALSVSTNKRQLGKWESKC